MLVCIGASVALGLAPAVVTKDLIGQFLVGDYARVPTGALVRV